MPTRTKTALLTAATLALACHTPKTSVEPDAGSTQPSEGATVCHVVFDAGSSGTRLHTYEAQADGSWLDHGGPKAGALADPVREQRGKTWADADAVASEIAGLLEQQRSSFDWTSSCTVASASVFATAGMRLAEQVEPERAAQMYAQLEAQLAAVFANNGVAKPTLEARTLTGFEEGLYAWLALPDADPSRVALAEMGGASAQVAFACPGCEGARPIQIGSQTVDFFSYSFLGLGTNEATKTVVKSVDPLCAYGVGVDDESWTPKTCEATMTIATKTGVVDPYNYGPPAQEQGPVVTLPIDQFSGEWRLSGGFTYWKPEYVQTCCEQRGECFEEQTSCFRALYLPEYLRAIGVPEDATPSDTSWTLGAVICRETDCLGALDEPLPCRWRPDNVCSPAL